MLRPPPRAHAREARAEKRPSYLNRRGGEPPWYHRHHLMASMGLKTAFLGLSQSPEPDSSTSSSSNSRAAHGKRGGGGSRQEPHALPGEPIRLHLVVLIRTGLVVVFRPLFIQPTAGCRCAEPSH